MVGTTKYSYEVVKYLQTPFKNYFINLSFIDNLLLFKFENLNIDYVYGFGILTSVLLLFCVLNLKKYRGIAVFFIILIYATANIDFLQKLIYDYFPAGGAIRVIGRYVNILCPVFAIILANFIENFNKNSIKTAIIVLLIIEQLPAMSLFSYSKKEAFRDITKYNVPKTCNVIFLNYSKISDENYLLLHKIEIDGMWLALAHKIYTVNGYTSILIDRKPVKLQPECIIELKD